MTLAVVVPRGAAYAQTVQEEYIQRAVAPAQHAMAEVGIPASVAIGQSALETGWGRYAALNNYFGIKCVNNDPGSIAIGCRTMTTTECGPRGCGPEAGVFRVYATMEDSFRDYGRFLHNSPRYAKAFNFTHDPDQFIREVHAAGYATDPEYANKVISIMRTYNLYRFNTP
ncbi:glucosaminidase domain-containing protein, partial [Micromonospora sp. NPDC047707]|uniref:glucosaminidase domain-containing protein n=1 Tax=Micromonospora sp. NPDC047707 TaxID=3154498 RepID=UPI003454B6C4